MRKIFFGGLFAILCFSCHKDEQIQETQLRHSTNAIKQDSVLLPKFRLEINISDNAVKMLNQKKENLVINYQLYLKKSTDTIFLNKGVKVFSQVQQSNEIDFDDLKIPSSKGSTPSNTDIMIKLNIENSRNTLRNNILEMEYYNGPLEDIIKHSSFINLNGKLKN